MPDLETRLDHIINHCAPRSDNGCLHRELNGLSYGQMAAVGAQYLERIASNPAFKNLPQFDLDNLLDALPPDGNPKALGNVNAYKFHPRY